MDYEGLIIRKTSDEDQRQTRVYITDKGREIFELSHEIASGLEKKIVKHLTDQDIQLANELIEKILKATQEEGDQNENI